MDEAEWASPEAGGRQERVSVMNKKPKSQDAELLKAEFMRRVGKNICMVRKAAGKSQRKLAFECEMEPASICKIESGHSNPTVLTLLKISHALGVAPAVLLRDGE